MPGHAPCVQRAGAAGLQVGEAGARAPGLPLFTLFQPSVLRFPENLIPARKSYLDFRRRVSDQLSGSVDGRLLNFLLCTAALKMGLVCVHLSGSFLQGKGGGP